MGDAVQKNQTILVVDDEEKLVDVVASYCRSMGYDVVCAHSGNDALAQFARHMPSLVVLDLMLPDLSGEDVCRAIREKSQVPIIMLTAKSDEASILNGLALGSDDYVVKPFSPKQLMARITAVLRRSNSSTNETVTEWCSKDGNVVVDDRSHEVRYQNNLVPLTPNEYRLLKTLIRNPNKAFTRDELIAIALNNEFDGYDRIIDTHFKNIRQKLEPNPKIPKYILTVFGVGYKFGGYPDAH